WYMGTSSTRAISSITTEKRVIMGQKCTSGKTNRMKLMGVDVRFSKTAETTGIACLDGDKLYLSRAGISWESRKPRIPADFQPAVICTGWPLLPEGADELVRRTCELIFVRKPFHNRSKPGLSTGE